MSAGLWLTPHAALAAPPSVAHAAGDYQAAPLHETLRDTNWPARCPPRAQLGVPSTGLVTLRAAGPALSWAGVDGRELRTDRCVALAGSARQLAPRDVGEHREIELECRAEGVVVHTTYRLSEGQLEWRENVQFAQDTPQGRCAASLTRSQQLVRVGAGAPGASALAEDPCQDDGRARSYRLELEPRQRAVTAGGSLRVAYRSHDQWGCAAQERPVLTAHATPFRLAAHHAGPQELTVHVAHDAAEGEYELALRVHGAEAKTRVHVVSAARAQELFPNEPQAPLPAQATAEGEEDPPIRHVSQAPSPPAPPWYTPRREWAWGVQALLGVLTLLAAWRALARRRRVRRQALTPAPAPAGAAPPSLRGHTTEAAAKPRDATAAGHAELALQRAERRCPTCDEEFSPPLQFCPHDGTQLQQASAPAEPSMACPVCRRGFTASVRTCPDHHEELVALESLPAPPLPRPQARICPRCGERFGGATRYCGRDGAELVTLN